MDAVTAGPEPVSAEDPLMIDESLPAAAAALSAPPEPEQYILPDPSPPEEAEAAGLSAAPVPEKQYYDLKPAVSAPRAAAEDAPLLLAIKQEACLSSGLTALSEAASEQQQEGERPLPVTQCGRGGSRRSRRLGQAVETVPFKKRRRVMAEDMEPDEYLLPEHVQDQVERAAAPPPPPAPPASSGRRLRPKRAAQLAASVELDPPPSPSPERSPSPPPQTQLKQEPLAAGGGESEHGDAPPPRRKRGRPRKSQAPQRCAPPPPPSEDDVTAAGDGDSSARAPLEVEEVEEPREEEEEEQRGEDEEPQKEDEKQRREDHPAAQSRGPRRGRKSAVPPRRRRPLGRPPSAMPSVAASPTPPASQDADAADQACPESPAPPSRPSSPPPVLQSRVSCPTLSVSRPLTLSDELQLLEVPNKRRQRPCPFCGSLTGCPPPDVASEHNHLPVTVLTPRRRLRVVVDGTAPSDGPDRRREVNLADQDGTRVSEEVACRRRGRRRATSGSQGSSGGPTDLECRTCGKVMLSISRLKKHQLVHTDERPFHCDKCPKSFKSVHVLNAHQLTHINYRPFRCELCRQTFAKKWTLRGHMATHDRCDGADGLKCTTCGCEFLDRSTYDSHVKIHTGERKWECKVCHRGFAKKLKLRKHMVVHSQAMLHKCNLCDREFRWKEKLVKHVMLHTGERPFKCAEPRCSKSFRAHSDLNVHLRNVHKKQPKKLDYPIVKSEPKPNHCELLLMRVNEMDGIPPCDLCTKSFASKDEYLNHVIPAHRDQEAYVCHPCKRVFDNKQVYEDHQDERHRRGEIMWRCQLCPKIFNKRSLFEGHKTLHATKYQCKICFRFASDEKRLQAHIIGHQYTDIDNSSHACTICSRQFKLRFSLKNHMFKMHSIDLPSLRKPPMRKFECSICHARFVRPTPAYNHMVRVHNIRPEPEVQDLFDLTSLSVDHPDVPGTEGMSFPAAAVDADDPSMLTALQNSLRVKVQAMAAQGMWDASEADGSTYLGGSAARRRQPARAAPAASGGDGGAPAAGGSEAGPSRPQHRQQRQQHHAPPPPPPPRPPPPQLQSMHQQHQQQLQQQQPQPPKTPPPPQLIIGDDSGKTLLHLSPGKRGHLVHVAGSPPQHALPPVSEPQRQQIIVIQQEGEEEIDLSRVLGSAAPADAQTLTMNADGVLVDDQGNPVSLMVEGGGTATHLLEYLRAAEPVNVSHAGGVSTVRPPPA